MFLCFLHGQEPDPEPTLRSSAGIRLVFISLIQNKTQGRLPPYRPGPAQVSGALMEGFAFLPPLRRLPGASVPASRHHGK